MAKNNYNFNEIRNIVRDGIIIFVTAKMQKLIDKGELRVIDADDFKDRVLRITDEIMQDFSQDILEKTAYWPYDNAIRKIKEKFKTLED